jgi:hypothetical protein
MKKRKNWKVAVGVVAVALIGVGVTAGLSKGFTSWDIKGNFTKKVENKPVVYETLELFKTAFEKNIAELDSDTTIKETEVIIKKESYLDSIDNLGNGYINCVNFAEDMPSYNYLDNNLGFVFSDKLKFLNFYGSNYYYSETLSSLKNDLHFSTDINIENNIFKIGCNSILSQYFEVSENDLVINVKENSKLKKIGGNANGFFFTEYLTNDTINLNNYSFEITNTNYEKLSQLVDLTTAKKYMKIIEG